jgi:hypothetical protein
VAGGEVEESVRAAADTDCVIAFEFATRVYRLTDEQATLLAESLRNYAKGKLPREAVPSSGQGGKSCCTDGALALAEFTEEALVGNLDAPLPLEGKAAEAMFWAMRRAQDVDCSSDLVALRDALGSQFVGTGTTATPGF